MTVTINFNEQNNTNTNKSEVMDVLVWILIIFQSLCLLMLIRTLWLIADLQIKYQQANQSLVSHGSVE